ncbi:sensor histidine kinase [Spongiimicrobium salis]|uniref:sensor histidine kinase n=1 Tax=Spongiimicrobium salis TaxID=1667022 RepID=UPI00374CD01A
MGFSQDPSYFIIGEEALKNAEIYSVLQTRDLRLYIATNEGLYEYKHGAMNPILSSRQQNGIALFNLRENSKGEVFCYNLTGQIFIINKNRLELFNSIPDTMLAPHMSMEFDAQDNLLFKSKGCYRISRTAIDVLISGDKEFFLGLSKLPDNRIFIAKKNLDTLYQIKKGKIQRVKSPFHNTSLTPTGFIYALDGKLVHSHLLNQVYSKDVQNRKYSSDTKYVQFTPKEIWRRRNSSGIETLEKRNGKVEVVHQFFTDFFISDIAKGYSGELFLGTFGKGLIVVPDQDIEQHRLKGLDNTITSIVAGKNNSIFLADKTKGILKYEDNKVKKVAIDFDYVPTRIFYLKKHADRRSNTEGLFYGPGFQGALKNIDPIDDTRVLISTSQGVYTNSANLLLHDHLWERVAPQKEYFRLKDSNVRCQDAVYAPNENSIYIAAITSLFKLKENGEKEVLTYKGSNIIANDLMWYKDQLWAATQNHGILIIETGKPPVSLSPKLDFVDKIVYREGHIYISHKSGFQIFDTKNESWETIGLAEGVENGSVKDFTISEDYIWFLSNNKLISIPLQREQKTKLNMEINIDSLLVSGKSIFPFSKANLNHKKNKLEVYLNFKGIIYEKEAFYKYQLKGFDEVEQQVSVLKPKITYNYLPPGAYSFVLKTVYRDNESAPVVYDFVIKKAFWKTWSFYLFSLLGAILTVMFYYRLRNKKIARKNHLQLERQRLKTNSLESELRALRAQMNPHFIFNSLNSIQDLILKEDTDASYDYIVLFSDLVRNSLTYSEQGFITLEEEVKFLETYLTLEKLRFGDAFTFKINSEKLEAKLPSLIVQPFVENAIIHGLFHKEGRKELSIDFIKHPSGIQCTIKDNGVGRSRSREIQKRQGVATSSYALKAIKKRLKILGEKHQLEVGFTITDLNDQAGNDAGTKVVLILPNLLQ